jgi:hypothetical protein
MMRAVIFAEFTDLLVPFVMDMKIPKLRLQFWSRFFNNKLSVLICTAIINLLSNCQDTNYIVRGDEKNQNNNNNIAQKG